MYTIINIYTKYTKTVTVKEIIAKSILHKHKKFESWFLTYYGMNLYRGCAHNCVYCDGRAEKYQVDGEFGVDVTVKINAIELLRRELDPHRKRTPFKKGFAGIGGGVGDSYQPVEEKYGLCKKALHVLYEKKFPVHVLTKSTLVERDIEIIKKINEQNKAILSFSFSSVDDKISSIFEPGVPPPSKRLETLARFKDEGISCGMFLMPVIPFITDKPEYLEDSVKKAKEIGLDYIVFAGMTLKEGRQKDYFYNVLKEYYPDLLVEYNNIYQKNQWGAPKSQYNHVIHQYFNHIAKKYKIPMRIPPKIFAGIVSENDKIVVMLEHIDYILKMQGEKSPYGYAAYSISQLKEPIRELEFSLRNLKGVGPTTERIVQEIIRTGKSTYYDKLLNYA